MSRPKSKMLTLLDLTDKYKSVKKEINTFLDDKDLSAVTRTCRQNRRSHYNDLRASELLFNSLNIDETRKARLFSLFNIDNMRAWNIAHNVKNQPKDDQSIMLTRTNGRQVYFGYSRNVSVSLKIFSQLSPLEAAVLCGDFHLVRLFLKHIESNEKIVAVLQLKKMRKKLESDPRSFVLLIKSLLQVYKDAITYNTTKNARRGNQDVSEVDKIAGLLGEGQKNLPWFILQAFCQRGSHENLLDYTKEPTRHCFLYDYSYLDLDSPGIVNGCALFKGESSNVCPSSFSLDFRYWDALPLDAAALENLSKVILIELDKIIELEEKAIESRAKPTKLEEQEELLLAYPNLEQLGSTPSPSR